MSGGWERRPFEDCIERVIYTNKIQRRDFLQHGAFPIVSQEEGLVNGYWNNSADLFRVQSPVVLFGDHTRALKYVDFDFVLGADGVKILKPKSCLDPRFFYYALMAVEIKSLGYARHYRQLKELEIGFPPIAQQQRIVRILDEAFEGIATVKASAEQNLRNTRALFESHLYAVFEQSNGWWSNAPLGEVCDFEGGSQPPKAEFVHEGRSGYIRFLQIRDFGSEKHITFIPESKKNRVCSVDDILIGRYGASVGKILTGLAGAYNVALMKATPDPNRLDRRFFYHYLRSGSFQDRLKRVASRSAQDGFGKEDIFGFPVPIPALDEQRAVVLKFEPLAKATQQLSTVYENKLRALEAMKRSLLNRAFTGGL